MKTIVKVDGKPYEVSIDDLNTIPVIARIGNEVFEIYPESSTTSRGHASTLRKQPAVSGLQSEIRDRILLSPLPGIVTQVFVRTGQSVQAGDALLIIEAMKMKNTLRASRAGTVASLLVEVGKQVKHHQPILEFAE